MSTFISNNKIFTYQDTSKTFEPMDFEGIIKSVSTMPYAENAPDDMCIIDSNNHIWMITYIFLEEELIKSAREEEFEIISCGDNKVVALDINGNIWYKGYLLPSIPNPRDLIQLTSGTVYTDIAYDGGSTIMAIDSNGDLWGYGNNMHGILGIRETYINEFTKIKENVGFKKIYCRREFSLCIDTIGNVWGSGDLIRRLIGKNYSGREFIKLYMDVPIQDVSGDDDRILLLTHDGRVFTYGVHPFGESSIIIDTNDRNFSYPRHSSGPVFEEIAQDINVEQIYSHGNRSMLKDVYGNIWIAGWYGENFINEFYMLPNIKADFLPNQKNQVSQRFKTTKSARYRY